MQFEEKVKNEDINTAERRWTILPATDEQEMKTTGGSISLNFTKVELLNTGYDR